MDKVVEWCPEQVLLGLRLVSRAWCIEASKALFHTIKIDLDGAASETSALRLINRQKGLSKLPLFDFVQNVEIELIDDDYLYSAMASFGNLFPNVTEIKLSGYVNVGIDREARYCDALQGVLQNPGLESKQLNRIQLVMALQPAFYFTNLTSLNIDLSRNEAFLQYLKSDWSMYDLSFSTLRAIKVSAEQLSRQEIELLFPNPAALARASYSGRISESGGLDQVLACPSVELNTPWLYMTTADNVTNLCVTNTTLQQLSLVSLPNLQQLDLEVNDYRSIDSLRRYPKLTSLRIHRMENVALSWPSFFKLDVIKLTIPTDLVMPYVRKPFTPPIQSRFDSLRFRSLEQVVLDIHWQFAETTKRTDSMEMRDVVDQFKRWCPNLKDLRVESSTVPIPRHDWLIPCIDCKQAIVEI